MFSGSLAGRARFPPRASGGGGLKQKTQPVSRLQVPVVVPFCGRFKHENANLLLITQMFAEMPTTLLFFRFIVDRFHLALCFILLCFS